MSQADFNVVTGAFGYTGRYITRRLLATGQQVKTLTGHPDRPNPFNGQVSAMPFNFERPDQLAQSLEGATTLYNTYWVRFSHGGTTFEQAIAKEALRLAFIQHKSFATVLKGVQQQRTIADAFEQAASGATIVNMMSLDMLIGSGGVLSHVTMIDVEPKPLFFLAGVEKARFRRTVLPGDQLRIQVDVERVRRGIWFYRCEAYVDDELAVAAAITCAPGGER